jgi:DNA-binding response OmpR family regulator
MTKINREKKRVLCVEDHEDTCELLRVILANHTLVFAGNFADGLLSARRRYFDLYLLDNWLPGGSGVELCRRIREFDPHTPILFCSAAAYERDREAALSAGAQAYLVKPVTSGKLEQSVTRLLVSAGERVLEARRAELAALRDELRIRRLENAMLLEEARENGLRARERAREKELRLRANQAFLAAGGTRGDFARLWPSVLQDEVRGRSDGRGA